MSKKHKQLDEKRLATAYDAGYFDGYHQGVEDTHDIWVNVSKRVKGIGPALHAKLIEEMTNEALRRQEERGLKQNKKEDLLG